MISVSLSDDLAAFFITLPLYISDNRASRERWDELSKTQVVNALKNYQDDDDEAVCAVVVMTVCVSLMFPTWLVAWDSEVLLLGNEAFEISSHSIAVFAESLDNNWVWGNEGVCYLLAD